MYILRLLCLYIMHVHKQLDPLFFVSEKQSLTHIETVYNLPEKSKVLSGSYYFRAVSWTNV